MTLMMRLVTSLTGRLVGKDAAGNVYYEAKRTPARNCAAAAGSCTGARRRPAASRPNGTPGLHYTTDLPIPETVRRAWQKPHEPNLTGTPLGYRPPGSDYLGGKRPAATGDYESWTPGS